MSCYNYVDQYANECDEVEKENVLIQAAECLQTEDEQRTRDLYEFIDDFINSQEFLDYVTAKKNIMKRSVATQCEENEIIVEVQHKNLIEKYPFSEEQKKMMAFKEQFEKYAERQSKQELRKRQERGIKVVKEKINAAKIFFECTKESRQREKEKRDEIILQNAVRRLGINFSELRVKGRATLLERATNHQRVICTKRETKQQNILKIIKKLLFEYKVKQEVIKYQNKTYDYKVKRKEKIIKDMEVVGTKIELIDTQKVYEVPEEPKEVEKEPQPQVEEKNDKKKRKSKEKNKVETKEKKEKATKDQKPIKEKGGKKEKKEEKLEIPFIPIVNPREKVISENIDQILDIVEEFRNFDSKLENVDMLAKKSHHCIPIDAGFASKPNSVFFQNYDEQKSYRKTIIISNISSSVRKIRFLKFSFENDYDEIVFDIENFGIQKLFAGCHVKFSLTFRPYDCFKAYNGKMIFLTYHLRRCQYSHFELDVQCIPKYSTLLINPSVVNFGRMAIWKAKSYQHFKTLKIRNEGAKPCLIYIHKIADPLGIESIFEENDKKENIAPTSKTSFTITNEELLCIEDIIWSCIDNVDSNFYFEESFFTLEKFDEKRITIFFKNADYVGNYLEKYTVDVYEKFQLGDTELVGCQEVTLLAETTGQFLSVNPAILDFGICQINSCYQLNFEMFNNSDYTQAISVRLPSEITDMVQTDISMVYLSPKSGRLLWIKMIPREYIYKDSSTYFDKSTCILEFPIHLKMITTNYQNYPPVKVPVYAILSTTEDMTIMSGPDCSLGNFLDTILMDMKTCTIYETIWTEIFIQNNTAATQICGFIDLPQCVTLEPNWGFVKLYPNQKKKFKLYLSPEIRDFPSFPVGTLKNNKLFFKLKIDTISHIGQLKKEINPKKLKDSFDMMLKELGKKDSPEESSMLQFMAELKENLIQDTSISMLTKESSVKVEGFTAVLKGADMKNGSFDETLLNCKNFVILDTNSRKYIWCKATLERPLLEFSHQTIEFPDTPCGSYSVVEIQLRAVEKEMEQVCGFMTKKKRSKLEFQAAFKITGNSKEISVEPKCRILRSGDTIKITLLAKPNVPQEIVEQTAKSIKYSEIYEMKLQEFLSQNKEVKKDKGSQNKKGNENNKKNDKLKEPKSKKNDIEKNKKGKNSKGKDDVQKTEETITQEVPTFVVTDKEMEYNYLDLYPAEMVYWRNMDPYYIKAKFTCHIDYQHGIKFHKKPDILYLDAICKVTRPNFITNLNLQRVEFEKCLIGMSTRKEIMLQNINYDDIEIKTTLLNPAGSFSIPLIKSLTLPPEHSLRLLIDFAPILTNKVTEYVEIRSDATILPLILYGEGLLPNINITPEFTVFRLDTKQNKLAELHLKIQNASESQANISIIKVFEIEGCIGAVNKQKRDETETSEKPKQKKENKEKKTYDKGPKYSDSLTERELESIDACFNTLKGESHFNLSNIEQGINIDPNTHYTLTIFFGDPELLRKRTIEKKGKKEKGEDKNKKGENKREAREAEKEKPEVSESKKDPDIKKGDDVGKQFITQYNIFVGKTFIKSVILVCTTL